MNAFEVSLGFYNLFFDEQKKKISLVDWLDNSTCDDIAVINLEKDTVSYLYHIEKKYFPVEFDGTFSHLFEYVINNNIHPEDRDKYDNLLNPKYMINRLRKSKTRNFRFAHFRVKLLNEEWRYVETAIITGPENGLKEGEVKYYVFDIQNMISHEKGISREDATSFINVGRDDKTGLYLDKQFFNKAQSKVDYDNKTKWCLISIDIEHFNLFDEWYGREVGNQLLKNIGTILIEFRKKYDGIAGYLGQDDFVMLMPFNKKEIDKLYEAIRAAITEAGSSVGFFPCLGIALLSDSKNIEDAFDKASIAVDYVKKNYKKHILLYRSSMHVQSEKEFSIVANFMQALRDNEITFYLQPQCRISTKALVGAESLCRWIKKDGTVIPPGEFIPILEKYGFIPDLDMYIWDKVFNWVKSCLDRNLPVVPISLNVSQVDIVTIDVSNYLEKLVKKYNVDPKLFKIEITESAYAEETEIVEAEIKKLREIGFTIFMDDFGSGYSSLNRLGDLNFEVIKLDGQFFLMDDYKKSIHIIESIVNMSKSMGVPVIVEGVESQEETEFLKSIGVQYVQGYYFYRPMPITQFEELITTVQIDERGFFAKINEQFRIREFLDENVYSDSMLNDVLGPVAIYALNKDDESVDIVRFNQQFYESVDVPEFSERLHGIEKYMPEEDRPVIIRIMKEAIEKKVNGASGTFRFYKTDGTLTNFLIHFFYLGEQDTCHRFYGKATNITDLIESKIQMRLLTKYTNMSYVFFKATNGVWSFKVGVHGASTEMQMDADQFEHELNTRAYFDRVDKEERSKFKELIDKSITNKERFEFEFTLNRDDNTTARFNVIGDPVTESNTNVGYIITFRPL